MKDVQIQVNLVLTFKCIKMTIYLYFLNIFITKKLKSYLYFPHFFITKEIKVCNSSQQESSAALIFHVLLVSSKLSCKRSLNEKKMVE